MKNLFAATIFILIFSCAQANNIANEEDTNKAFRVLLKNQHIKLSRSQLCKTDNYTITAGDLIANILSYAIDDKKHITNLKTRCDNIKAKGKKLLDCEISIYMPSREGASSSFRFTADINNKLVIHDSFRCF